MLGVLLGVAIAVHAEPKLEWATFGEFSAKLNEGSGYRLTMDKSVSDRPVVWHFSKPGTDKFALLRRSCKELCLNFEIDEELKKVFIVGPNADAGPTLQSKIERSLRTSQEFFRAHWNDDTDELRKVSEDAIQREKSATNLTEGSAGVVDAALVQFLLHPESRALVAALIDADVRAASVAMAKVRSGQGAMAVSARATRVLGDAYRAKQDQGTDGQRKEISQFISVLADGGRFVVEHRALDSGHVELGLTVIGNRERFTACRIEVMSKLNETDQAELLVDFPTDDKVKGLTMPIPAVPHEALHTVNGFQGAAVAEGWNTMAWFDPSVRLNSLEDTLGQYAHSGDMVRARLTEDGWFQPYLARNRWPEYSGEWSGVIASTGKVRAITPWRELLAYLNGLSDAQLDGMAKIDSLEVADGALANSMVDGWLLRAGLRELAAKRMHAVEGFSNQLSAGAAGDLSRYWLVTKDEGLLVPSIYQNRGRSWLSAYEQARITESGNLYLYVVVELWVPNGTYLPNGDENFVKRTIHLMVDNKL